MPKKLPQSTPCRLNVADISWSTEYRAWLVGLAFEIGGDPDAVTTVKDIPYGTMNAARAMFLREWFDHGRQHRTNGTTLGAIDEFRRTGRAAADAALQEVLQKDAAARREGAALFRSDEWPRRNHLPGSGGGGPLEPIARYRLRRGPDEWTKFGYGNSEEYAWEEHWTGESLYEFCEDSGYDPHDRRPLPYDASRLAPRPDLARRFRHEKMYSCGNSFGSVMAATTFHAVPEHILPEIERLEGLARPPAAPADRIPAPTIDLQQWEIETRRAAAERMKEAVAIVGAAC